MHILQVGAAKTGNFWLSRILHELSSLAGWEKRSFIQQHPINMLAQHWKLSNEDQANLDFIDIKPEGTFFRISSIFRMPIDDFDDYLSKTSIVWSHSYHCNRSSMVIQKFDKTVYLIRDPRDMTISFGNFAFTPYYQRFYPHSYKDSQEFIEKNIEKKSWGWMHHIAGYLKHMDELQIHVVFYERLKNDFVNELKKLGTYLGMDLTPGQIHQVEDTTSLQAMRISNPDHVRKGKAGGWTSTLSPSQQRRARFSAGPMLQLLNYPATASEFDPTRLPSIPISLSNRKLRSTLMRSRARTLLSALINGQVSPSMIASQLKL